MWNRRVTGDGREVLRSAAEGKERESYIVRLEAVRRGTVASKGKERDGIRQGEGARRG